MITRLALSALAVVLSTAGGAAGQTLGALTIEARASDASRFEIAAAYRLRERAGTDVLVHRAMVFPDQRIDDLRVSSSGRDVPFRATSGAGSMELRVEVSAATDDAYDLTYRVRSEGNPRLPIFVPISCRVPPDSRVHISFHPPPGLTVGVDSFPRLTRAGGAFDASLVDVPSFLLVPLQPAGAESWLSALTSVGALTNLALSAMVIGASGCWWRLRRRAISARQLAETRQV